MTTKKKVEVEVFSFPLHDESGEFLGNAYIERSVLVKLGEVKGISLERVESALRAEVDNAQLEFPFDNGVKSFEH